MNSSAGTVEAPAARSLRTTLWPARRALKSGVVALEAGDSKSSYFYILFAFIAGFSERFARDMLLGATGETSAARGRPRGRQQQADPPTEGDPLGAVPAES